MGSARSLRSSAAGSTAADDDGDDEEEGTLDLEDGIPTAAPPESNEAGDTQTDGAGGESPQKRAQRQRDVIVQAVDSHKYGADTLHTLVLRGNALQVAALKDLPTVHTHALPSFGVTNSSSHPWYTDAELVDARLVTQCPWRACAWQHQAPL